MVGGRLRDVVAHEGLTVFSDSWRKKRQQIHSLKCVLGCLSITLLCLICLMGVLNLLPVGKPLDYQHWPCLS